MLISKDWSSCFGHFKEEFEEARVSKKICGAASLELKSIQRLYDSDRI